MTTVHEFPSVPAFGHLPTPEGVDVVGIDLPVGRLTAYRVVPSGPSKGVVLVVPGYTGSKEDWRTFMPLLREAGWTAVAISRRGQADSAAPTAPSDYSLDEEAADVVRVAALLDDGAPVHLIGHSLGGVIAREAAIASPQSFRSLVQFCSGPYGWPYRKVTELTILHDTGGNLRQLFDATNPLWAYRPDEELPDDARMVRDRFDATSPLSVVAGGHILEDHTDSSAELRATGLPVLVAHGEWDGAWPIPWQRQMAEDTGARYEVVPTSYHGPHVENPTATIALFDDFLAGTTRRSTERPIITTLQFPDGFLWGAATAAHQIEGNNVNSNWWVHEHEPDTTIVEPSGDAADSYHRYREDIRIAADLGLNSYRFSIEWARIEPERGHVSRAEVDHYRRMVEACHEAGIEPIVTLMHFTVPRWFERDGFWRADDAADLFARYTEAALPVVQDGVRYVCTINEPNIAAMLAGGEDAANLVAYGLPNPDLHVADQLLASHERSREVLSQVAGLQSGWTIATQAFRANGEPGSEEMLREYGYPRDDWYLEQAAGDDFLGVQAYTRTFIGPDGPLPVSNDVETTLTGWEFWPEASADGLRSAWELSGHVPLMITENGIATADDSRRVAYTQGALEGIHRCIEDGIEVLGYQHWSLLDNYEWASGYRPTFGLVAWDRETFARTPKDSARWYGKVAQANALETRRD